MRARCELAALAALAGSGCAEPGACEAYAAEPAFLAACAAQHLPTTTSVDGAEAACRALGPAAESCIAQWVARHAVDTRDVSRERVLALCGGDQDCAFQVLDQRPSGDVVQEVTDCRRYATAYGADCVGHALQRFSTRHPGAEECAAALALPDPAVKARMLPGTCP